MQRGWLQPRASGFRTAPWTGGQPVSGRVSIVSVPAMRVRRPLPPSHRPRPWAVRGGSMPIAPTCVPLRGECWLARRSGTSG
jgi:hypothetical protein